MQYLSSRAAVVVDYVPATDSKPARIRVKIRDFPNRLYSVHGAPDGLQSEHQAEYFARMRVSELGLNWLPFRARAHVPGIGDIFTTGD